MKHDKIIPIDAPDIVEKVELTAWKTKGGQFYLNESAARHESCTHDYCGCGNLKKTFYTLCERCIEKKNKENFSLLPRKKLNELREDELIGSLEYDSCPIGNIDDIEDWLEDYNDDERDPDIDPDPLTLADLRLVIFRPYYLQEIDPDRFSNLEDAADEDFKLPEDSPILKAIDELNRAIAESKTILGYEATNYVLDLDTDNP